MKYMILMYASQRDYDAMAGRPAPGEPGWTGADFEAVGQFMERFAKDLAESGELVDTRGLTAPSQARRIRLACGAPSGPTCWRWPVTGTPPGTPACGPPS